MVKLHVRKGGCKKNVNLTLPGLAYHPHPPILKHLWIQWQKCVNITYVILKTKVCEWTYFGLKFPFGKLLTNWVLMIFFGETYHFLGGYWSLLRVHCHSMLASVHNIKSTKISLAWSDLADCLAMSFIFVFWHIQIKIQLQISWVGRSTSSSWATHL